MLELWVSWGQPALLVLVGLGVLMAQQGRRVQLARQAPQVRWEQRARQVQRVRQDRWELLALLDRKAP